MKNFFFLLLLCCSLGSFGQEKVIFNDEHVVMRDVSNFQSVVVSGPFKVYYSTDSETQVAVSANNTDARDRIITKVSNGTLYINLDNNGPKWWSGNREFKVYITAPKLNGFTASGAVNVVVVDVLKSTSFNLNFSGASDFSGRVEFAEIKVNLSGASDTKISGVANKVSIVCTGASSFKGAELKVNDADLVATGASSIKLSIKDNMKARASGASNISFFGNPQKNNYASGASSIKSMEN